MGLARSTYYDEPELSRSAKLGWSSRSRRSAPNGRPTAIGV